MFSNETIDLVTVRQHQVKQHSHALQNSCAMRDTLSALVLTQLSEQMLEDLPQPQPVAVEEIDCEADPLTSTASDVASRTVLRVD